MNRVGAQVSRQSMYLEQARLRLRERFQSKFLDTLNKEVSQPTVAAVTLSNPIITGSNDSLQEARLRIRQRFLEKFPPVTPKHAIHHRASASIDGTLPKAAYASHVESPHYLEEARLRIRERFQAKFPDFTAFPETVEETLQHDIHDTDWGRNNAIVVTSSTWPYPILGVNKLWEDLCGFPEEEVLGKTFDSLGITGTFTEAESIHALTRKLAKKEPVAVHLTNATKDGTLFRNYLRVRPLYSDDEVTHFVGVLQAQQAAV